MANRIAGGTRNAWRDIWLQFPGERHWKPAGLRRRQAQDVKQQIASHAPAFAQVAPSLPPDDIHVRRLANILERALAEHGPQYRRRSDHHDAPFDDH